MVLLSVESENGAVLTYRLAKSQITVGSSSRNDVVVRAAGVGDRHLVIHRNNDVFTFVTVERQTVVLNGERRSRGVLNPGDRIRVAGTTLVFRGGEAGNPAGLIEVSPSVAPAPREDDAGPAAGSFSLRPDPIGFGEARERFVELFREARGDRLRQVVGLLRETLPEAEFAIVAPGDGDETVALTSVWSGELPRVPRRMLGELTVLGRYAVVSSGGGTLAVVPIYGALRELSAMILARPLGALGDEGVSLIGEVARLLGLQWREVERDDATFTGWELEARHRLEAALPGSSQAVQVLRSGMLAAAHGNDPVLICGAPGTGRTEVARILATLGPIGGRSIHVYEPRTGDIDALREELFGASRHPSFGPDAGGVVGSARGGVLLLRDIDRFPPPIQSELAALISAQQREQLSAISTRWVVTCREDPLALVQQGKLASPLFLAFSQHMLRVPRLDERREDLPLLIAALLHRSASEQKKSLRGITLECLNVLLARTFPGEMADLVGEVNRLVTATPDGEMVRCDDKGVQAGASAPGAGAVAAELSEVLATDNLKEIIPRVEQHLIDRVMRKVKGNQSKGARILGISRGALIAKLKEYSVPDYRYLRRRKGIGV
ncbi:MAG: helix-turn-helix domain-containing protein [Acidobacteriota bacterium]